MALLCLMCGAGVGVASGQERAEKWKEFAPKGAGFAALFPEKPKELERVVKAGELPLVARDYRAKGAGEYAVMYFDVPVPAGDEKLMREMLDGLRGFAVGELEGTLLGEKEIKLEGYRGRLLEVSLGKNSVARVMLLLTGNRVYRVSATMSASEAAAYGATAKAAASGGSTASAGAVKSPAEIFFESFKLVPIDKLLLGEVDRYLLQDPAPAQDKLRPNDDIHYGGMLEGKAVSLPKPHYPPEAMRDHVTGHVRVKLLIDEEGKDIAAQAETGPKVFHSPCEKTARLARFTPTLIDGKPVKVLGFITYSFYAQ